MVGTDGLRPIVALLDHTVVPLINKAHAAGIGGVSVHVCSRKYVVDQTCVGEQKPRYAT